VNSRINQLRCCVQDPADPTTKILVHILMEGVGGQAEAKRSGQGAPGGAFQSTATPFFRPTHPARQVSISDGRSLASEPWTFVDTYLLDGKHFLVAVRGDARRKRNNALSPRESQALRWAVCKVSNKIVAYEMGISASTVGVLLHRAAVKLGCQGRAELLRRFRELDG
jgi:DNA-binding CsgD family transcriptional regulator